MVEDKKNLPQLPKEEEIAFLKGAVSTLVNERNELVRMVQNVDIFLQANMKRLGELGVKISGTQEKK
jgi:hypothetical protein